MKPCHFTSDMPWLQSNSYTTGGRSWSHDDGNLLTNGTPSVSGSRDLKANISEVKNRTSSLEGRDTRRNPTCQLSRFYQFEYELDRWCFAAGNWFFDNLELLVTLFQFFHGTILSELGCLTVILSVLSLPNNSFSEIQS
jgi:hypothetical protein